MRMVSGSGDERGELNDGIADAMVNSTEDDRFVIEFPSPDKSRNAKRGRMRAWERLLVQT